MEKNNIYLEIFDALFIMLLCFGTLLSAMLMSGKGTVLINYTVHYTTLGITVSGLIICLAFILTHSEKGLKSMTDEIYGSNEL